MAIQTPPNIIGRDEKGCPYSPLFEDIYASRDGAAKQALYVFLKGNGLPERWQNRPSFSILENGFGLGTNFLVTLREWRADPKRPEKLNYLAIEKYPLDPQALVEYADPELKELAVELSEKWPLRTPGAHRIDFENGQVALTIFFSDVEKASKNLTGQFDAFYLDGFSPAKNPQMWQKRIFNHFARHACPNATVATWCVASDVRKALHSVGFEVKKVKGFGHKSEMTVGVFAPHWKHARAVTEFPHDVPKEEKSVLIVGAGLAGAALASEFCVRDWKVAVVESGALPATGASAIRWGLVHSQFATDDNLLFRLTRAGLEAMTRQIEEFPELAELEGLFQITRSDEEFLKWQEWFKDAEGKGVPEEFISFHSRDWTLSLCNRVLPRGGILHQTGGLIAVGQWVRERLNQLKIDLRLNQTVESLKYEDNKWKAIGSFGEVIAEGAYCVLATAAETGKLIHGCLPITRWTGRISLLTEKPIELLKGSALTGPGYLITKDDWLGIGATYENTDAGQRLSTEEENAQNLEKLGRVLDDVVGVLPCGFYEGIRAVAPDRMPYIGKAPFDASSELSSIAKERLYVSCAFGSRGAVLTDLAAQMISATICGEPLPVEKDLAKAVDPKRFEKKGLCS
ncbi:MAG: tRNA (5-methylaminomethyl-2-thiouridine)(34)-methyltransferase MnmD [Burkholderiales bacterium]|nr:tRNA (5-methylaminomethyl-2-thiouridine)(34)-methyltransferase MnmD [Burkholderiales bacterium]